MLSYIELRENLIIPYRGLSFGSQKVYNIDFEKRGTTFSPRTFFLQQFFLNNKNAMLGRYAYEGDILSHVERCFVYQ